MAMREKGGMWCPRCKQHVTARKMGRRVRNTAAVGGAPATFGASLLFGRSDRWHCSTCGGDVTRAPSPAFAAAQTAPVAAAIDVDEVGVTVVLVDPGPRVISVMKVVRDVTRLGLRQTKELVESAPVEIARLPPSEAGRLVERLEQNGGRAEILAVAQPEAPGEGPDLAEGLRGLVELHESGALTAEEFSAAKAKLLGAA